MLRGIGCNVTQVEDNGEQRHITAVNGHFGGSTDGTASLPTRYGALAHSFGPFLLEFKTGNARSWSEMDGNGVQKKKPQHWGQVCVYGYKQGIKYAIYALVNKNDSQIYWEVIELEYAKRLISKAEHIIMSPVAPPRLSENPSDYRCKQCDHHSVCHMKQAPDVNCRSCKYSSPIEDKQWRCNKWGCVIPSKEAILAGCDAYSFLDNTR